MSMAWQSPTASQSAMRLEPPELMNGIGMPIGGTKALAIIMFTQA
jgi:hypothetical protein